MKRKIKKMVYNFVKSDGIVALISAIIISFIFVNGILIEKQQIEIIDWTTFTSIIVALALNGLAGVLKTTLMNWLEDFTKLTDNYDKLASKYRNKMITYNNALVSQNNLEQLRKFKKIDELEIRIPVICEFKFGDVPIIIRDSPRQYKLPEVIQNHFDELFAAHATSTVYNQLNIRVDDWKYENGTFIIMTSRTTYFDSLVTNRAMDFLWENGLTIREQFEFGPFLHSLKESSLSNHIGFNGFIESSDGYIVFVKRGTKVSIGKGTYGNSIGASLKAKYALNDSGIFTENGLKKGILKEIEDELKIPESELEELSFEKHLVAAYRDIVEGGKPQLLFFIRTNWTKDVIENNFISKIKKGEKSKRNDLLEDGKRLLWIPRVEFNQLGILPDMIFYQGKAFHMVPSATASVVMLIEYLRERGLVF